MPFKNEHSARLKSPGQFDTFRRINNQLGQGIDVIFGIKEGQGSEIQAIRFDVKQFTVKEAKDWLKDHDFTPILFEEAITVQAGMSDADNELENFVVSISDAKLQIEAKAKVPTFTMVAYAGNAIMQEFSNIPVIIDISSVIIALDRFPILKDHKKEIGHSTRVFIKDNQILAEGTISLNNEEAKEVVDGAKNNFPWQASVRGPFPKADMQLVRAGEVVSVNGKQFRGPALIAKNMRIKEISVLALGADDETSVTIAAQATQINNGSKEELIMTEAEKKAQEKQEALKKEEEIKAEAVKKEDEIKAEKLKKEEEIKAQAVLDSKKTEHELKIQEEIKASNAAYAKNLSYRTDLEKICNGNNEILAKALEGTWSLDKAELETIKAGRTQTFNINQGHNHEANTMESIEIAAAMSMGVKADNLVKMYSEQQVEIASINKGIGIKQVFEAVCNFHGLPIPSVFGDQTIRAAFTTISLPDIFSNALNKVLLQQYDAFDSTSLQVSMQSDVQDFKQIQRTRLVGTGELLEVAGDGELKSGTLDEDTFNQQISTFGRLIWLTRKDIINDELGAFAQITRMMGRKGIQKRETLFWDLVKNGETSNFFSAGNNNLLTGANSVLSIASISTAIAAAADQKAKDGTPVAIRMRKLVVPPALESTAKAIIRGTNTNTGALTDQPDINIHSGEFELVVVPFLSASTLPVAGSNTAWYLAADGDDIPAWDTAYLRGQRTPIVETGESKSERLAINWRIFWDLGVAEQDFRAAVKSTGV